MDLDLARLRQFVVLVRVGSFARAAEELHLSQPTLTRTVQTLEAQVGERLLERARGRRGVVITPHGATLVRYAEQLLFLSDEATREITQRADSPEYLAFGMGPRLGRLLLPGVLARLTEERPNATIQVLTAPTTAMRRQLDAGELSFLIGIGTSIRRTARITSRLFVTTRPQFYVRREHSLAGVRGLTSEDVIRFPLVSGTDWPEGISSAGPEFDPRLFDTRVRIDSDDVLTELTLRSDAVMLSTLGPETGLVALDFPLNPVDVLVFWHAGLPLSGLAELVVSRLVDAAQDLDAIQKLNQ